MKNMKNIKKSESRSKLRLNKETVRILTTTELGSIVAGNHIGSENTTCSENMLCGVTPPAL